MRVFFITAVTILACPVWAGAGSNLSRTSPSVSLTHQRLAALALIETGCSAEKANRADHRLGRSGEVSRYQILPLVWRQHSAPVARGTRRAGYDYQNPVIAQIVAERIVEARSAAFVRATGRAPDDFEWYALWNAPGELSRVRFEPQRLPPIIKQRALRFCNLMTSSPDRQTQNPLAGTRAGRVK